MHVIGMNDELRDVIRKCNANFAQASQGRSSQATQADLGEVTDMVGQVRNDMAERIEGLASELRTSDDAIRQRIDTESKRTNVLLQSVDLAMNRIDELERRVSELEGEPR